MKISVTLSHTVQDVHEEITIEASDGLTGISAPLLSVVVKEARAALEKAAEE